MLTKDFVPSYENGFPIWMLVFLLYCLRDKDPFSAWHLSAIAAGSALFGLIMAALGIASTQLLSELGMSNVTSDTNVTLFKFAIIASIQMAMLFVHIAVGLLAATCLRIFHSLFQWALRANGGQ